MDIFILKIPKDINSNSLKEFQHKNISDCEKLVQHCYSYYITDYILKNFYKINNRKITFLKSKPYLESREKFFSISHSKNYVVVGFSDYECGVDIEKITPRNIKKISSRMGFNIPRTIQDFYADWTKYEAEYKMGSIASNYKTIYFDGFIVCACTSSFQDEFQIYNQFPKLNV